MILWIDGSSFTCSNTARSFPENEPVRSQTGNAHQSGCFGLTLSAAANSPLLNSSAGTGSSTAVTASPTLRLGRSLSGSVTRTRFRSMTPTSTPGTFSSISSGQLARPGTK